MDEHRSSLLSSVNYTAEGGQPPADHTDLIRDTWSFSLRHYTVFRTIHKAQASWVWFSAVRSLRKKRFLTFPPLPAPTLGWASSGLYWHQ